MQAPPAETDAIQASIDKAAAAGGGTVTLSAGEHVVGTLRLLSGVRLWLDAGCMLRGSTSAEDYDPEHRHILWAADAVGVSVSGHGVVDGRGHSFWDGREWREGRPNEMLRFDRCQRVLIEGIEVRDGTFWNLGFSDVEGLTVRGVTVRNDFGERRKLPNTDGLDIWNCRQVTVSDCDIQAGDDCLVVLGDRGDDSSRDVSITNCKFATTETALVISGVRNLTFSNSTIRDAGCGIGFRAWHGVVIDGVRIDNIVIDVSGYLESGGQAIYLWSFPVYTESPLPPGTPLPTPGVIDRVTISNVTARCNGAVFATGFREPTGYIGALTLENVDILMAGQVVKSELNDNPPDPYPIYGFHHAPYAMFLRYVRDLTLRNVTFCWDPAELASWGSALRVVAVSNLALEGFVGRQALQAASAPAVWLRRVDRAVVRGCRAPEGTGTFVRLGEGAADLSLLANDLSAALVAVGADRPAEARVFAAANRPPRGDGGWSPAEELLLHPLSDAA